jgi:hypothetical protein
MGMPILCYGWPAGASGQGDMVGTTENGEWVLNQAEVLYHDGRWRCQPEGWRGDQAGLKL